MAPRFSAPPQKANKQDQFESGKLRTEMLAVKIASEQPPPEQSWYLESQNMQYGKKWDDAINNKVNNAALEQIEMVMVDSMTSTAGNIDMC